jgi:hypothetical protein
LAFIVTLEMHRLWEFGVAISICATSLAADVATTSTIAVAT